MRLETIGLEHAVDHVPGEELYSHSGIIRSMNVTITYALVRDEHDRRLAACLSAVTDEAALAALLALPADDIAVVPERFRRLLAGVWHRDAIITVVSDLDGTPWASRRLAVPTRPITVEIHARHWREGVRFAHRWNGLAARVVSIDELPEKDRVFAMTEASVYGIGLRLAHEAEESYLVSPATYAPLLYTAARWNFAEAVYEQFRDLTGELLKP